MTTHTETTRDHLERAYAKLHRASDQNRHDMARYCCGLALDELYRAGARDLAADLEREMDRAIGHPRVSDLADRVYSRMISPVHVRRR